MLRRGNCTVRLDHVRIIVRCAPTCDLICHVGCDCFVAIRPHMTWPRRRDVYVLYCLLELKQTEEVKLYFEHLESSAVVV